MGMNTAMNSDIYAMINLTQDSLFNDVQVNPNYSTIHVPTNVYDQGKCVCLENVPVFLVMVMYDHVLVRIVPCGSGLK